MKTVQKFIYVFSEGDRDLLLDKQYALMKSDDQNGVFIFINVGQQEFAHNDISFVLSDTLTF